MYDIVPNMQYDFKNMSTKKITFTRTAQDDLKKRLSSHWSLSCIRSITWYRGQKGPIIVNLKTTLRVTAEEPVLIYVRRFRLKAFGKIVP